MNNFILAFVGLAIAVIVGASIDFFMSSIYNLSRFRSIVCFFRGHIPWELTGGDPIMQVWNEKEWDGFHGIIFSRHHYNITFCKRCGVVYATFVEGM